MIKSSLKNILFYTHEEIVNLHLNNNLYCYLESHILSSTYTHTKQNATWLFMFHC